MPPQSAGLQFENKVRGSFKRIGFRDVAGGAQFIVGGIQVDAVGGWDDVLLVIEATHTSQTNAQIRDRIFEIQGKQGALRRSFRTEEAYRAYRRIHFVLVSEGFEFSDTDRKIAAADPIVHLMDYQVLEYYQDLASTIGKQPSLFNLLGELDIPPQDLSAHRTPAFKVEVQKNLTGYLFFCEPQKLLEVAYVARRETGRENYYQRMLTTSRLKSIKNFIDKGGVFPNNIILAFDDRPQFKPYPIPDQNTPSWLEWGELAFPKSYRAAWIIDGQHRLYAFGEDQSASSLQKLPVFAFEQMPESKQAEFFIQINREQKPVSPDLIWDLEADLRPDSIRGQVALTAKRLNVLEPFRDRIYFPLSGVSSTGRVKISSICNDISEVQLLEDKTRNMTQSQRNPLTRGIDHRIRSDHVAQGIATFFSTILEMAGADIYRETVLLRPGGITLGLNVYEQILIKLNRRPQEEHLREYVEAFLLALEYVIGDSNPSTVKSFVKNRLTSYAQRREITTTIVNSMREALVDDDFGKQGIPSETSLQKRVTQMERKFATFIADVCDIHSMDDFRQKTPEGVWRRIEQRSQSEQYEALHSLMTLGEINDTIKRKDNRELVMRPLTEPNDGFRNEDEVFVALSGVIGLRNPLQHGRPLSNRALGEAYLATFERLLS